MCCGNKRTLVKNDTAPVSNKPRLYNTQLWSPSVFEYTGNSGLTVIGNITRKSYRFNAKGDTQAVDYRDAGNMLSIKVLQRVV